jgi:sulfoquinovose isomerase
VGSRPASEMKRPAGSLKRHRRSFAAVDEGWAVEGAPGFLYTTNWHGRPRERTRLHWVMCEALGAATALFAATGNTVYSDLYEQW